MGGKREKSKEKPASEPLDDKTLAPVRKSSRIKQNSKFEERMSMFVMNNKKDSESEEDDEDDLIEIKERKASKVAEKLTKSPEKASKSPEKMIKSPVKIIKSPEIVMKVSDNDSMMENDEMEEDKIVEEEIEEDFEPPKKVPKRTHPKLSRTGKRLGRPRKRPPTPEPKSEEEEPAEEDDRDQDFNPGMLNLRRVGEELPKKRSTVSLNARGMPQRIRKKNKLFFDDNIVIPGKKDKNKKLDRKPRKPRDKHDGEGKHSDKPFPSNKEGNAARERIGLKLRNLLKLPKAQRWVFNEFFYSNIDQVLFHGTNDFILCLDETFGHLRTMKMTRTEWCVVRRLMGKPRRCSQSFFREERQTIERRRDVIRLIQQRKIKDASQIKDLPDKIPLQLSVNARVTAKLRFPQTGLFTGKVDAVDPSNNTYRITFDRPGLGTHSIPDYDVLLNGEPDMVSMVMMQKRYQTARHSIPRHQRKPEPMFTWPDGKDPKQIWIENLKSATFPGKFYETMIRICKILKEKKSIVDSLGKMNGEAEKMILWNDPFPAFFQRRYAELLIELESLNLSLNRRLNVVQKFCHDIVPDICETVVLAPTYLREKNIADAKATMNMYFANKEPLKNHDTALLVVELMALVLQLQNLTRPKPSSQDRFVLKQTLQKVKGMISPENLLLFQNSVEVHIKYIETQFSDDNHLAPLLVNPSTSKKSLAAVVSAEAKDKDDK